MKIMNRSTMPVQEDLSVTGSRPASARDRPSSATKTRSRSNNPYKKVGETGYVDESLFGKPPEKPEFEAPWGEKIKNKDRPLLWVPPAKSGSSPRVTPGTGTKTSPWVGPGTGTPRTRPVTPGRKYPSYRMIRHKESFVDETLFGPKPEKCGWEAPWGDQTKKPKPMFFSPTDYRKKLSSNNSPASSRPTNSPIKSSPLKTQMSKRPSSASSAVQLEIPRDIGTDYWAPPSSARSTARTNSKAAPKPWR